jgi:hypothetical protein
MASDSLYLELAKAYSQPSRAYRATQEALKIPFEALGGYAEAANVADQFRKRKLMSQTLDEALSSGIGGLPVDQAENLVHPALAYAALTKANQEKNTPQMRMQQGQFQYNGMLTRFDPLSGTYEALSKEGWQPIGVPKPPSPSRPNTGPAPTPIPSGGEISPRVPPTIPTAESDKLADLSAMREALGVVKQNFSPEFVGPINARLLKAKQTSGIGATEKGALFTQSVQDIKDRLLRARSGAQINEQEYQRLVQLVPDQFQSIPDFTAKLGRFQQVLDSMTSTKRQELIRAGYRGAATLPNARPSPESPFGGIQTPSFNTPEEADASGYKGPAIIGGRKAVVH